METIHTALLLLRLGIGIPMILFGISQMRSPRLWLAYIPKIIRFLMPVRPESFMRVHAVGNLGLGLLLALGVWEPTIIWITIFWWLSILPFAFFYEFSVGLRDTAIILALIAMLVLHNAYY